MSGVSQVVQRDLCSRDIHIRYINDIVEIDIGLKGLAFMMTYFLERRINSCQLSNKTLAEISKFTPSKDARPLRIQSSNVKGYERTYHHVYFYLNGSPVVLFKSLPPTSDISKIEFKCDSDFITPKNNQLISLVIQSDDADRIIHGDIIEITPSFI